MNRTFATLGATLVLSGGVMYVLLQQLQRETFRADLPPYFDASLALIGLGILVAAAGTFAPRRETGRVNPKTASRLFGYAALVNALAACLFAVPVLIPALEFPVLITRWPGIYMVIGYLVFVVIGVLGSFAWGLMYGWLPEFLSGRTPSRPAFLFHIAAMESGTYLTSIFMFIGGYIGSAAVYAGAGDTVVGIAMEVAVIPSAIGIFLLILSNAVAVASIALPNR